MRSIKGRFGNLVIADLRSNERLSPAFGNISCDEIVEDFRDEDTGETLKGTRVFIEIMAENIPEPNPKQSSVIEEDFRKEIYSGDISAIQEFIDIVGGYKYIVTKVSGAGGKGNYDVEAFLVLKRKGT